MYVDATAEFPGNGRSESPYRRITDAHELARCIRQAQGNLSSAEESLEIRVAPGEYLGTYKTEQLDADETLEELPIVLNIPNLILRGSTMPELDENGRPTGEAIGPETILTGIDPLREFDDTLILVTDTMDGMVGNQTTIEGFTLRASNTASNDGGIGILTLRVDDFVIRHNIFEEWFSVAIDPRAASGGISSNHIKETPFGMFIEGPGTIDIHSNRVRASMGGINVATTVEDFPFTLGVQGGDFSIDPFVVPTVAHLGGTIVNNDLSGHTRDENLSFGLRLTLYGFGTAEHVTEQSLSYVVSDNTIQNNVLGVVVDAGHTARNDLTPNGDFSLTFSDNDVSGNCRTSMIVSFTRWDAALFQEQVNTRPYLQDSTYDITFNDGDEVVFADRWTDHPAEDPVDGRALNNVYIENGNTVAPLRFVPFDPTDPEECVF